MRLLWLLSAVAVAAFPNRDCPEWMPKTTAQCRYRRVADFFAPHLGGDGKFPIVIGTGGLAVTRMATAEMLVQHAVEQGIMFILFYDSSTVFGREAAAWWEAVASDRRLASRVFVQVDVPSAFDPIPVVDRVPSFAAVHFGEASQWAAAREAFAPQHYHFEFYRSEQPSMSVSSALISWAYDGLSCIYDVLALPESAVGRGDRCRGLRRWHRSPSGKDPAREVDALVRFALRSLPQGRPLSTPPGPLSRLASPAARSVRTGGSSDPSDEQGHNNRRCWRPRWGTCPAWWAVPPKWEGRVSLEYDRECVNAWARLRAGSQSRPPLGWGEWAGLDLAHPFCHLVPGTEDDGEWKGAQIPPRQPRNVEDPFTANMRLTWTAVCSVLAVWLGIRRWRS